MRTIKFRAWDKQENKMLYRELFDMNWYTTEKNTETGSNCWGAISGGQRSFLEVMRVTDLLDKNGKEIYEGDILQYRKSAGRHIVEWDGSRGRFHWSGFSFTLSSLIGLTVVGNIYENPDILPTQSSNE